nr:type I restriction endonuclease subunit R [Planctomycetota bacterium]
PIYVVLNEKAKQSQLEAAIKPVAERLLKQYAAAKEEFKQAKQNKDDKTATAAKETMDALLLFRGDLATYLRAYTFLSQIFDYGNTDFEKRSIFYRCLQRLLKFGLERESVDLSQVKLTHHNLKNRGKQSMHLTDKDADTLNPITEAGSGSVQEKVKAQLSEIIEKVNDLFEGELTENDKLVYVNNVILGKLLESETLVKQAGSNSKEQFGNSPDLNTELTEAIMNALDAHTAMSTQALNSKKIKQGLKDILLNHTNLYEALRERSTSA